ncbi:MAG: glycoside hydrolase family 9 protein [Agriterribacter sp.]
MKKIYSILLLLLAVGYVYAQETLFNIQLNQCGFYPAAPKIAIVTAPVEASDFYVISSYKKDTVYKGKLGNPVKSDYSAVTTRVVDFSTFNHTGQYFIYIKNAGSSPTFNIVPNIHHSLSISSIKAFYYQRVSMPLENKFAGKWARSAGHPDTAVLIHASAATQRRPAGFKISSPGGWYDAGDYNKYIVNSGITVGTMLSAYEDFTKYFDTLKTNIPESNNTIPDILDEALYNIRWMLTMQDPDDGGVYHKCTNAAFDSVVMPGVTKLARYAVQKGTAATLDFAAVMAQASRIFSRFKTVLPGLSDTCLHAALYAWQWAEKNPDVVYDQTAMNASHQPAITTGAYGDKYLSDEQCWASAELLITTGDAKYAAVLKPCLSNPLSIPSWSKVDMLGWYTILRHSNIASKAGINITALRNRILQFSDSLIANGGNKAFQTIMGQSNKDFIWGSNAVAMNQSILLINSYLLSGKNKYLHYALSNLDYVLGRNATGYCFVTGIGHKSPMHIHHRPSQADGIAEPVPGLMAGGPNPGMQDKCYYPFTETETAYTDNNCAYACNEIAINWNAPLVYVAGAIEFLTTKPGF